VYAVTTDVTSKSPVIMVAGGQDSRKDGAIRRIPAGYYSFGVDDGLASLRRFDIHRHRLLMKARAVLDRQ
jgi:hypothetical protein